MSEPSAKSRVDRLRRRIYEIIEVGRGDDQVSNVVDYILIALILLNVAAYTLETVPDLQARYGWHFKVFEVASVLIFTMEYIARLWTSIEVPFLRKLSPWRARLRFARRPYLVIDLLAILPFYLSYLFAIDLRILRLLRIFRFLKIARYSPALHSLIRAVVNERRALAGALFLMIAMLLFASTGIYLLERDIQPQAFGSIPSAAWWGIATLTTVGYGDMAPVTPLGRMFGAVIMVLGLGMFALPIAIISTGFAQETSRREFVVTWSMIARFPLFAELEATEVAEVMGLLQSHQYPPNTEIISAGDDPEALYFIAAGEVEIDHDKGKIRLSNGEFFGEMALIEDRAHRNTITTLRKTRLLELGKGDFQRLSARYPDIPTHIRDVVKNRAKYSFDQSQNGKQERPPVTP